ncbi:tRNA threonylcarbamoyladenosine dehydratase [Zancudomyces culisetae]|uniref:tRNA threonylcarbamoyladenosine dehydratase n=1 Tax=Zancudomyces culisetae TaxID=1213189 RepID=A0A1R1PRX9_ZANCU|nr:tRNA threonylcarbamoyladenosine dehydratase [Zancudomyces culisetae]|eukprot:OMH83708.1 tRNA threonylcarbamoyladenosine dehydratase [Zancudomyces culisetae]
MASKLEELTTFLSKNNNAQLAIVAAAASVATLVTVFSIQGVQRKRRVRKLKEELGDFSDGIENMNQKFEPMLSSYDRDPSVSELFQKEYPNRIVDKKSVINLQSDEKELFSEQLARNKVFFGEEGLEKIMNSFVIVVGAGGVGSWAVMMLLRSGVQRIRIIDFDQVTLSSLNRHAVASRSDVGTPKTVVLQQYIQNIVPHALIDARVELFSIDNASELLSGNPDYVIDCIDNITTKLDLLKYCYDNNLRVISSMGSGMKSDPSRIQIADIGNTFEDPLSRSVRRQLKKMGIEQGIEVVYSTEKPGKVQLLPLSESQEESAEEFAVLPDFRVRIVPVLGKYLA